MVDKAESISALSEALVSELTVARKCVATAESCTGGWIAKSLTDNAGSSACFAYGIVSYSNGAKESILGVQSDTLKEHGAVSHATVGEMADGALKLSGADFAVAVSGVAGPGGGSEEKPVGTVWIAWASRTKSGSTIDARKHNFKGGRDEIRTQSVVIALQGIRERLRDGG